MRLLRQHPAKAYTENDIQVELIGTNVELSEYSPSMVDKERRSLSESLAKLVHKGEVYKKVDGSEATYGIKRSLAEKTKLRIDKSDTLSKVQSSRTSLDRRVKGVHGHWLAVCRILVGIAAVIIPIILFFWS